MKEGMISEITVLNIIFWEVDTENPLNAITWPIQNICKNLVKINHWHNYLGLN